MDNKKLFIAAFCVSIIVIFFMWQSDVFGKRFASSIRPISALSTLVPNLTMPMEHSEKVDFRVIVLTLNRPKSLQECLDNLNSLEVGSSTVGLDIFVDRVKSGQLSDETLKVAKSFKWDLSDKVHVTVWPQHVGIYGQWIDSVRPPAIESPEISLILEDDLSISPHTYKWLKAAHAHYGHRKDIAGYSITCMQASASVGSQRLLKPDSNQVSYLYRIVGSHGFSPHPRAWHKFQVWFHTAFSNKTFHPYVPGLIMTSWYKDFEKHGTEDSMWEMWFIWYTNHHKLYTVYPALDTYTHSKTACLCINREEPGLHRSHKGEDKRWQILRTWKSDYVKFPDHTQKIDYDGTIDKPK